LLERIFITVFLTVQEAIAIRVTIRHITTTLSGINPLGAVVGAGIITVLHTITVGVHFRQVTTTGALLRLVRIKVTVIDTVGSAITVAVSFGFATTTSAR